MQQAPVLKPDLLLAKSFEPGKWKGSYSLVGHTADVVNAVSTLVDVLGDRLIEQFGLQCSLSYLRATARLAAYLHDWGKANNHFQGVVRGKIASDHKRIVLNTLRLLIKSNLFEFVFYILLNYKKVTFFPKRYPLHNPQIIRHEAVSVLLAWEFREWLEQGEGDFLTALAAAGGHHLKLGGKKGEPNNDLGEVRKETGDDKLFLYVSQIKEGKPIPDPRFRALLKYGVKNLDLPAKLSKELTKKICSPDLWVWSIKDLRSKRREARDYLNDNWQPDATLLAVMKSLLVAGDAIGSAIPSQVQKAKDTNQAEITISGYIQSEVSRTLNEAKLQQIVDARRDGNELYPFQIRLANSKTRVTLARAGCGTGKTLGAYNWAKSQAVGRKLFFCYPTTGTSTEGFLDYVHNIGNPKFLAITWLLIYQINCMAGLLLLPKLLGIESVLLHSRSDVDLEMATTGEEIDSTDETDEKNEPEEGRNEPALKLESFKAWGKESIVCTVDTVLGWLQCNRRPMYCFPAIAQAAFVFDEVHCYDEKLFGALLRFLEIVKAPVLLMSASFLPWQKEAIEKAVGEPIELISGDPKIEAQPRYRFNYQEQTDWSRVEQELSAGGKVLWVCNQVNTAIDVYKDAKARRLNAVLYHSRYRYEDRVKHHRAVVDGFKQDEPILAIATQVAEMSLDLSATLLISQIADPAGLIQRLGRLNRRYCGHALDALFYPDRLIEIVKKPCPYSEEQLNDGLRLIQSFSGEVCQRELAQWLEDSDTRRQPDTKSVLLDGSWRTYPTSLREPGFNITVLLEQDLAKIKSLPAKETPRFTVPIPAQDFQKWEKYKFYTIAPTKIWGYSSEFGAEKIHS